MAVNQNPNIKLTLSVTGAETILAVAEQLLQAFSRLQEAMNLNVSSGTQNVGMGNTSTGGGASLMMGGSVRPSRAGQGTTVGITTPGGPLDNLPPGIIPMSMFDEDRSTRTPSGRFRSRQFSHYMPDGDGFMYDPGTYSNPNQAQWSRRRPGFGTSVSDPIDALIPDSPFFYDDGEMDMGGDPMAGFSFAPGWSRKFLGIVKSKEYRRNAGLAMFGTAMNFAGQYAGAQEHRIIQGRSDTMADAGMYGSLIGGTLGGLGGAFFGGYGGIIGSTMGSSAGSSLGRLYAAPTVAEIQKSQLVGTAGVIGAMGGPSTMTIRDPNILGAIGNGFRFPQVGAMSSIARSKQTVHALEGINEGIHKELYSWATGDQYSATDQEFAQIYAGRHSALLAAGIDPDEMTDASIGTLSYGRRAKYKTDRRLKEKGGWRWMTDGQWNEWSERTTSGINIPGVKSVIEGSTSSGDFDPRGGTPKNSDIIRPSIGGPADDRGGRIVRPGSPAVRIPGTTIRDHRYGSSQSAHWFDDVYEDVRVPDGDEADPNKPIHASVKANRAMQQAYELARQGKAGVDVAKMTDAIVAATNETGGNPVDILSRFGPQASILYAGLGGMDGDKASLLKLTTAMQKGGRAMQFASTSASEVGGKTMAALNGLLGQIEIAPGGRDSLLYAQTQQQMRAARMANYGEMDTMNYAIPMTQLQGQIARSDVLPFSPGNRMGLEMQSIALNTRHLGQLQDRYGILKKRGDLSEDQELSMVTQMENLRTGVAHSVASLSEGMENRLPALSAGRPSFFARYNNMNLAALNVGMMGSPISSYGSIDGGQYGMQSAFRNAFAVPTGNYSNTQGMNASLSVLERIAGTLERIAGGNGGGGRPGENRQAAQSATRDQRLNTGGQM